MKITVTLPDEIVHQAKAVAKYQETTVSALVYLAMLHHLGMEGIPLPDAVVFGGEDEIEPASKKQHIGNNNKGSRQ